MKIWVRYSAFVWIITIGLTILLFAGLISTYQNGRPATCLLLAVMIAILFGTALWYAPIWVGVSDGMLLVRRPLRTLRIPVADIDEARPHSPTMGTKRISGSGGWFGYWGWFMEGDTGRYFAYYGRSSDCILLRLRGGRKYVIGCAAPLEILNTLTQN